MLVFQVYPVIYGANIALTNYGTGHFLNQEQALEQIFRVPSGAATGERFQMRVMATDDGVGDLGLFLTNEADEQFFGTTEGIIPADLEDATFDENGLATGYEDYTVLNLRQSQDRQDELVAYQVPTDAGVITVQTFTAAVIEPARYQYDSATDTLLDVDSGDVLAPVEGMFVRPNGERLTPGWRVYVGFENFTSVLTSEAIRGPFIRVLIWNFVFAIGSVLLTFALGLALALALNHPTLRGLRLYRSLLIFPYALPSFMTVLVWAGMFNQDFGIINEILGADIDWLRDPWLAKIAILLVNTWLGYAYFFLVSTGALQAIPSELKEAAAVDGATPWQGFRNVTFPLLMVAVAPLLISSFAFNFNNFNVVYLLTGGGPPIIGAQTPAGHTDILISYTYRLAFESGGGTNLGLASAISILIFLLVAIISAIAFRRTRVLEELT
jgi:arabinogalactan oligomer/maltooligosaccharide transport system permease protein